MEAEGTSSNFYRLINRNSRGSKSTVALVENGHRLIDPREQCRGFASFYEDLAIPRDSSSFDTDYKDRISADLYLIRKVAEDTCEPVPDVTHCDIETAIKKLHTKKAADEFGLVSEHLKIAGHTVYEPLSVIFSAILRMKYIPETIQVWCSTPNSQERQRPYFVHQLQGYHRHIPDRESI